MKQLKLDSNPYIIKNKNYSTITFSIIFPCNYDKLDVYNVILLRQLLMNSSFKYKTEQEFKQEKEKRLIITLNCQTKIMHNNMFIMFKFTIPDPKKVRDFDIDKAIEFLYEVIYNPNIIDNEFDNNQFSRERDYLKFSIENSLKKIYTYGYQQFINEIDDIGDIKNNIYSNLELLENSNPKKLYEYYKKNIINNTPICIVYGNITNKYINDLYYKYFKVNNNDITIYKDYSAYMKPTKKTKLLEENTHYNQSVIYMAYKVDKMKDKDRLFFNLLCNILNSKDTNLIFNKLRTENNLIYSHTFDGYLNSGLIIIEAYINKENKEKTIAAIKEIFDSLSDKSYIEECIKKINKGIELYLIDLMDSKYYVLDNFIEKKIKFNIPLEEIYKKYQKLDIDKFIEFLDRVKLDTIYFLKGDNNE